LKANHKFVASFAAMALLVALAVTALFWSFSQMKHAAEARKHTFVVIHSANELMSALIDAETGERGYLLTGDKAYLEPYLAVQGSISGRLEELRQASLSSAGHKHLDALVPLITAKLAYLSRNIELRRINDMAAALTNVRGVHGKPLMDSLRAEMSSFIQIVYAAPCTFNRLFDISTNTAGAQESGSYGNKEFARTSAGDE
jgi:two-component system sensor histidine kinase EvgS